MPAPKLNGPIVFAYIDAEGRRIEVYPPKPARRERQNLRKAGQRTSGRKTRTQEYLGVGSWKGVVK